MRNGQKRLSSCWKRGVASIRENRVEWFGFACAVFAFYYLLVQAGITTHDELSNLYQVRLNTFFPSLNWGRWSMTLMNALPSYVHALAASQWTYRLFTVAGLLIACAAFASLVRRLTDGKTAWLVSLLFFMFAQIELEHDGLIAFSFSYQFNTAYVFFGLTLFWQWLQTRKTALLIWSAVFYLLGCMSYEAFVSYGLLFFILDLYFRIDRKQFSVSGVIRDLALHFTLAVLYFGFYLLMRSADPAFANPDTTVASGLTIPEVLRTAVRLAFGLFPLNYRLVGLKDLLAFCASPVPANLLRWALAIALSVVVYRLVRASSPLSLKKYLWLSLFCAVGLFLPGAPAALTRQMIDWVAQGVKGYGVSYYAYFFLIAWIAFTLVFLYHLFRRSRAFAVVACVLVCLTTEMTLVNNHLYAEMIDREQDRVDLYCRMVETEAFAAVEDDACLYLPDYTGIHNQIDTLPGYANGITGKRLTGTNRWEDLDFTRPVWFLRADPDQDVALLGRIDVSGVTGEIFVFSLGSLKGMGILAAREAGTGPAEWTVDGIHRGTAWEGFISGDLGVEGTSLVLRCPGIRMETVQLYPVSGYAREPGSEDSAEEEGK